MAESKDAGSKPTQQNGSNRNIEPQINWQQVMGCLSANSISLAAGFTLSYTSSLFPALQAPESDIPSTPEDCAWLASSVSLIAPAGAFMSGFIMEHFGRLTAVQVTVVPFCIAWILIATAHNFTTLLIGRILIGFFYNISITAAGVLNTEVALKNYRGSFSSAGLAIHAFGVLCGYALGAVLDWRTLAWASLASPLVPFVLTWIFTAESPLWLRTRGRMKKAEKVSLYYYGDPNYVVQPVEQQPSQQSAVGAETADQGAAKPSFSNQLRWLLTLPSGLKPLIILNITYFLLNWSGVYIILVNAVIFFNEAGSTINPYYASVMIGVVRLIASFIAIFLLRHFKRRVLMMIGTLGMAVCIAASAYATSFGIAERNGGPSSLFPSWFTVACIATYHLAAIISIQTIPWTMASELFPQRVRGAAQAVNMTLFNIFMFTALQAYPWMNTYMGGAVGIQYFFAAVSLVAAAITWIFFPETQGKSLTEIEEYFVHNTIYLGHKKS